MRRTKFPVFLLLGLILTACTATQYISRPICPYGPIYLNSNDVEVISDRLVEEIVQHNLYCQKLEENNGL